MNLDDEIAGLELRTARAHDPNAAVSEGQVIALQQRAINGLLLRYGAPYGRLLHHDEKPLDGIERLRKRATDLIEVELLDKILKWLKRHANPTNSNADTLRRLASDPESFRQRRS
jgi:hypothetical protein